MSKVLFTGTDQRSSFAILRPLRTRKEPLFYATQFHNWQKKEGKRRRETEILLLLQGTKTNN